MILALLNADTVVLIMNPDVSGISTADSFVFMMIMAFLSADTIAVL